MSNYEKLRAECYKRLYPTGIPLEFGCEVSAFMPSYGEVYDAEYSPELRSVGIVTNSEYLQIDNRFGDILIEELKRDLGSYLEEDGFEFEVLGKRLEIADVLRALGDSYFGLTVEFTILDGGCCAMSIPVYDFTVVFNLALPLSHPDNEDACKKVLNLLK